MKRKFSGEYLLIPNDQKKYIGDFYLEISSILQTVM